MLKLILILVLFVVTYLVQAVLYEKHGMKSISYRCHFDREEVTEGDSFLLIEEIENRGFLPLPWIRSEYAVSEHLDFAGTHSTVTGGTRFVSSLFFLRSRSRIERQWHVTALLRGEYTIEKVLLVSSDLFGTARSSQSAEDAGGVLVVLPKCYETEIPFLRSLSWTIGEEPILYSLVNDPAVMAEIRPYTGYEPFRRIDWKTSARLGFLFVRNEEPVRNERLCVCFTIQKSEFGRRYVHDDVSEHTVRVLAQLFHKLTKKTLSFRVQSNCLVHGEPFSVEVDGSPAGYLQLLRYLSALDNEPKEMLRNCVTIPAGARLILVAPYLSEDIRRLKMQYPDADVILTSPCETGEIDFIPIYEEAESP
ncbi:MAG: DUF58 domain-containing protein [Oscillospiraceae bacterium]